MKAHILLALLLYCNFLIGQDSYSDAQNAMVLCSKESLVFTELLGAGDDVAENNNLPCMDNIFPETNSTWVKWQVQNSGRLGFTILPLNEQDDIDFILYKLESAWDDVDNRSVVRCMAAGENYGESDDKDGSSQWCTGATGLRTSESDHAEMPGCQSDANNFLEEVQVAKGDIFLLFINNYYSSNGVMIEFTGNTEFSTLPSPCLSAVTTEPPNLNNMAKADGIQIGNLYPNPVQSVLTVDIETDEPQNGYAQIINAQGFNVHYLPMEIKPETPNYSIPVAKLPVGIYFIKFRFGDYLMVHGSSVLDLITT